MRRIVLAILALSMLQFALGGVASGQTGQSCYQVVPVFCTAYSLYDATCAPPIPPNATDCQIGEFNGIYCEVVKNVCAAPVYWCPTCGTGVSSAGAPINLTNGNTYIQETDLRVAGLGGGLTIQRTWNSLWPAVVSSFESGMFGTNWRSTYEERVFPGSGEASGYMVYLRADGTVWYFPNGGALISPANGTATLTQNGTQTWTVTFKNGEQRVFSYATGWLSSIVDRNGNTTTLSYDASDRLTTVTDPVSRHIYFTYGNGGFLATSVTSDMGISLSYAYDSQGRLSQVTEPDSSTISFQYNSQSLISEVLDSNGIILESHTYDTLGRGLTSSRANGVDAITITYPQ
jgi:YD repeat-containing protein